MSEEVSQGSSRSVPPGSQMLPWGLLGAGLAIGLVGMYLTVTRPLQDQTRRLQAKVRVVEGQMAELVGARDQVWQTNNLLGSLRAQTRQLEEARSALDGVRKLRDRVRTESELAMQALDSLELIEVVQTTLIEQQDLQRQAAGALNEMLKLRDAVIHGSQTTGRAVVALDGLSNVQQRVIAEGSRADQVAEALGRTERLTTRIIDGTEDLAAAQSRADALIDLKETIRSRTDDLDATRTTADELLTLKDDIILGGSNTAAAQQNANRLIELGNSLTADGLDPETAGSNLESLLEMQSQLNERTADVVAAVQTLEILSDFQREFEQQLGSLTGMRRQLMEVVLLESTVGRVVQVLDPLIRLGQLRRLSDAEVRDAARIILEQRSTRLSRQNRPTRRRLPDDLPLNSDGSVSDSETNPDLESLYDQLVPMPPEDD